MINIPFIFFSNIELEFLAEWWSSSTCTVYTDDKTWKKMGTEHAILLLNHSYEVDWLFSWFVCEHVRMLGVSSLEIQSVVFTLFDLFVIFHSIL